MIKKISNLFIGEARMGTDDDTFISILTTNSFAQLRQIMIEYGTKHSHTLEEAIDRKFSYNVEKALLAIRNLIHIFLKFTHSEFLFLFFIA